MHQIAVANHQSGIPFMSFLQFIYQKKKEKAYKKGLSNTTL
jgi:hypothetical protein